jgi:signal transduction histidine kinase
MKTEFVKPELTVEDLSIALYHSNIKLDKANKELLQSKKELSEIYVNISHDLRSPVTAIRNTLEYLLLLDNLDMEEVQRLMKLMYGRVNYLEQLINDTFLLSAISSSSKVLHFENIKIGIFLEDFYYGCEVDNKYVDRRLSLEVPDNFPYIALIDTQMIYRVLDNLFTNALKYSTKDDAITLSVELIEEKKILITVADTGIGIAKEHLSMIFDRTYMVSRARTPGDFNGCGLGLSIAKAIVESHDGRIWCESKLGEGSCFRFTLPVTNSHIDS